MSFTKAVNRPVLVTAAIALGAVSAARAGEPAFLYTLGDEAMFTAGCFAVEGDLPQCLCPITLAPQFTGTFTLTPVAAGTFAVTDVQWSVPILAEAITGSGTYEVGTDGGGNSVQQLTLDLFFNGQGPLPFDSGLVEGGDDTVPPAITIPIGDGLSCPGTRMTISAAPQASNPADVAPPGGDGAVNTLDFLAILTEWGLPAPRATDIDGSGTVGTGDLLAVLSAWTG